MTNYSKTGDYGGLSCTKVDDKKVASGEFSNIKHNPIEQRVFFDEIKGKIVILKTIRIVDNVRHVTIGYFLL